MWTIMDIDKLISDSINEEASNIKVPFDLRDKVFHKINNESVGINHKHKISSLFKVSFAATIGLLIGLSINLSSPLNTVDKVATSKNDEIKGEYIQLLSANLPASGNILQMYPSYVPNDLSLTMRKVLDNGKRIELAFSSMENGSKSIRLTILNHSFKDIKETINEDINLSIGKAFFTGTFNKSDSIQAGRLIYPLNENSTVLIDAYSMKKEELIKVADSITISKEKLPDNTNDESLLKFVSEKLLSDNYQKEGPPSLKKAEKLLQDLNIPYVPVTSGSEDAEKTFVTSFTVREGVVYLFTPKVEKGASLKKN
jgi:hypothetical protein